MLKPYFIAVALLLGWLATAQGQERRPRECDEATALEKVRENRIEAEFKRLNISDPAEKTNRRAEIEKHVDDRTQVVKDICDRLLRGE
jgi:hypothetical protein